MAVLTQMFLWLEFRRPTDGLAWSWTVSSRLHCVIPAQAYLYKPVAVTVPFHGKGPFFWFGYCFCGLKNPDVILKEEHMSVQDATFTVYRPELQSRWCHNDITVKQRTLINNIVYQLNMLTTPLFSKTLCWSDFRRADILFGFVSPWTKPQDPAPKWFPGRSRKLKVTIARNFNFRCKFSRRGQSAFCQ